MNPSTKYRQNRCVRWCPGDPARVLRRPPLRGRIRARGNRRSNLTRSKPWPLSSALAVPQADHELVRRMAAGDQAALGELHDRFATLLHSVVLRIVGNADDAEEVLEETFWQAWRQA